jgi:hypothetical protein
MDVCVWADQENGTSLMSKMITEKGDEKEETFPNAAMDIEW